VWQEWQQLLAALFTTFPGSRYDLLDCNCNHFSEALLQTLNVEWMLPPNLNRGARVGSSIASKFSSIFKGTPATNTANNSNGVVGGAVGSKGAANGVGRGSTGSGVGGGGVRVLNKNPFPNTSAKPNGRK
jgi:hypothetical protein